MSNEQKKQILESIISNGDISQLTPHQKVEYYVNICNKLGLDPMSQPFRILKLHGREILYCHRAGCQQLNKIHKVSHEIKARETVNECYVVTAQAYNPEERRTESIGAVPIFNLKGEALCNAMMKAETKAKRRATLDLLGLGLPDETELDTKNMTYIDVSTGEIIEGNVKNGKTTIVSKKYDKPMALRGAIASCQTEEDLLQLYNDNKEMCQTEEKIKNMFSLRKYDIRNKSPHESRMFAHTHTNRAWLSSDIACCTTRADLTTLYKYNKENIDNDAELSSEYVIRMQEFESKSKGGRNV